MYVLIKKNRVKEYPYSVAKLRRDNPKVSMRKNPPEERLNDFGVFTVTKTDPPSISENQVLMEQKPVFLDGAWRQSWKIRKKKKEEIDAEEQQGEKEQLRLMQRPEVKVLFYQHNEIRKLNGEEPFTKAEFRKWWRKNVS